MIRGVGKLLIIGGDGVIGSHLVPFLRKNAFDVIETTRRSQTVRPGRLYCDLLKQEAFAIPDNIGAAIVLAAVADYEKCERDPKSEEINVVGIPMLIQRLLERGIFTIFTSSVTVFGGMAEYPDENTKPQPTIAYARQKTACESAIKRIASDLKAENYLAIVRITKSFDARTRPIPDWLENWRNGRAARPFTDLFFAPMTLGYISMGLRQAVEARRSGVQHLSGAENLDYATFCRRLAWRLAVPDALVEPINSQEAGIKLYFRPRCAALGMKETNRILGIEPQPVAAVIDGIAEDAKGAAFARMAGK